MDGMYCHHFGMREMPFGVTPDPRFFYRNEANKEILMVLQHAVESRNGVVVCTGEVGTGKTLLLKVLRRNLQPHGRVIFISNASLNFDEVLRLVLRRLSVAPLVKGRSRMLEQLGSVLGGPTTTGQTAALLIDEAQDLSEQTLDDLRLLSNLESAREQLLQIVLIGEPDLEPKLDQPELAAFKQRVALRRRIRPLEREEISRYLAWRLRVAGYKGQDLFDRLAVDRIAAHSAGIPRLINTICDAALRRAYAAGNRSVTPAMIEAAVNGRPLLEPLHGKNEPPVDDSHDELLARGGSVQKDFPEDTWEISSPVENDKPLNSVPWESNLVHLVEPEDLANPEPRSKAIKRHKNIDWPRIASVTVVGALLLGGAVWYSQQNVISLPQAAAEVKNLAAHWALHWQKVEAAFQSPSSEKPSVDNPSLMTRLEAQFAQLTEKAESESRNKLPAGEPGTQAATENIAPVVPDSSTETPAQDPPKEAPPTPKPASRVTGSGSVDKQEHKKESGALGTFDVVGPSYVRDKPTADAEIVATLQPGTRVQVLAQSVDYFRVRSLEDRDVHGYVHREDAFFRKRR